jgi:hypothetical protein
MNRLDKMSIKNSARKLGVVLATGLSVSGIAFAKMNPVLGAHLYLTDFANIVNLDRETLNWMTEDTENEDKTTEQRYKLPILIGLNLAEDPRDLTTIIANQELPIGDRHISKSSWVGRSPNHQVSVIGDMFQNQTIAINSVASNHSHGSIAMSGTGSNSITKPLNSSMDSFGNTTRPILSPLPTQPILKLDNINTVQPPEKLTVTSNSPQNWSGGGGTGGSSPANSNPSTTSTNDNQDKLIDAQIATQKPEQNQLTQEPQILKYENTKSLIFMVKSIGMAFNFKFYHLFILLLIVAIDYRVNRS